MMDIKIYSNGLVHCSICAPVDATREDVEFAVNTMNPTGISSSWKVSEDKFADGSDNPRQCENDKDRKHYLMVC